MAPRARPGLRAGWAAPAGGSWPLKAGRGLCVRCAVQARAGALCFAPDGEIFTKITPQTHNTRKHRAAFASCESSAHVPSRSPGGESGSLGPGASAASASATPSCVSTPRRRWWSKPRRSSLRRRCQHGGTRPRPRASRHAWRFARSAPSAEAPRERGGLSTSGVTLQEHRAARSRTCPTRRCVVCGRP